MNTPGPGQPFGPVDYEVRTHRVLPPIPLDIRIQALRNDLNRNAIRRRPLVRMESLFAKWIVALSLLTVAYFAWQFVR